MTTKKSKAWRPFKREHKYKAVRSNGFSSKLESAVYDVLKVRQGAGEIKDIKCQQLVILQAGSSDTRIAWRVDFSFVNLETGETEYAEAKGIEQADYKLKLKLWRANPPAALEIWKGHYRRPKLVERIEKK